MLFRSLQGDVPKPFFDPHTQMSETGFSLKPQEEILIIFVSWGFGHLEEYIFELNLEPTSLADKVEERKNCKFVPVKPSENQLCMLVQNTSLVYTISVGRKTPLELLLQMPYITSHLCFYSMHKLNCLRSEFYDPNNENQYVNEANISIF